MVVWGRLEGTLVICTHKHTETMPPHPRGTCQEAKEGLGSPQHLTSVRPALGLIAFPYWEEGGPQGAERMVKEEKN